ncbi:MAG TPA: hypothetical protein VGQ69_09555 [Gemmatimonadales bacterium]|jgi:hypothetical protein|nr:hypothetical protein [Gemmatimonadales bacterium]
MPLLHSVFILNVIAIAATGPAPIVSTSKTNGATIQQPSKPEAYETIIKRDWSTAPDKAELERFFIVEGGLNECKTPNKQSDGTLCDPHLPVSDFYDLIPDPLFGKVIRYNGGPQLNTTAKNMPGRVAKHPVGLRAAYTHLWVRQFIRFSPNFTTMSKTGGQGGPSYKVMFLRYEHSAARHEFDIDNPRGVFHKGGNPGLTKVSQGQLPWHNTVDMNTLYPGAGWFGPDFYPFIKVPGPYPAAPSRSSPYGNGNGEWIEVVLHHKTVAERGEFTMYWRQYTLRGEVVPQAWKIHAVFMTAQAGQVFPGVTIYLMGVNRNRQYDEPMFVYWGPYEIVDGSRYPNPWNLPGG